MLKMYQFKLMREEMTVVNFGYLKNNWKVGYVKQEAGNLGSIGIKAEHEAGMSYWRCLIN